MGLAGSRGKLCRVVWSRCVLSHEGHPSGGVGGRGRTSLLWTSRVLQRLVGIPGHPARSVLLHRKTLENKKNDSGRVLKQTNVNWEIQTLKAQMKKQVTMEKLLLLRRHETLSHLTSVVTNKWCCPESKKNSCNVTVSMFGCHHKITTWQQIKRVMDPFYKTSFKYLIYF